jgi:response regulator of citrate/malate metabolism
MSETTITVLLVDDDAGYATVAKHLLRPFQGKKFNLLWDDSGEKALERLRADKSVNLVLMDYYLPNSNGLAIVKMMASENIKLPVIFLTANKDFRIAVEALKYGVEDYLIKEDTADSMLPRSIMNVLERVQLRNRIGEAEKEKMISQKKTEAVQEVIVTMCHEFNNPLAAIKISADILSRQSTLDENKQILTKLNANITLLEKQIIKLRDINLDKLNP